MRSVLLFVLPFTFYALQAQKLVYQKSIRLIKSHISNPVRLKLENFNLEFAYGDFFSAGVPDKIKKAYDGKEWAGRWYFRLNEFNEAFRGKDSLECKMVIQKRIFELMKQGNVFVWKTNNGKRLRKVRVYIDNEIPAIVATRWVFTSRKKTVIWQFEEVSIGSPAF
ncbi:MAG TPA: hypothetical protein VD905_03600 [Flavobacteriales bacterium]|nr:hypothetical protein [Flavobacteriales bacterium]